MQINQQRRKHKDYPLYNKRQTTTKEKLKTLTALTSFFLSTCNELFEFVVAKEQ
jgi:hypothetical protein